jgi:hypothetical protein
MIITLVSLVTFTTVGYSVYVDASNAARVLGGNSHTSAITAKIVIRESVATVYLNVTLANDGLYPIVLSLACLPQNMSGISCSSPTITVLPGQTQTLHFTMTVENYTQSAPKDLRIHGRVKVVLEPFASIALTVDLGTLLARGGI